MVVSKAASTELLKDFQRAKNLQKESWSEAQTATPKGLR
jgi:hypothetical protein